MRQVSARHGEATTLNNLGYVYDQIGQPEKAIEFYTQALPIRREIKDRREEATTLNNLGHIHDQIGQPEKALEFYTQALLLKREVSDRRGEAITLNNLGSLYDKIGQPEKALEYYIQALPIRREVQDPSGEAATLNNIGLIYARMGQPQKALEFYNQALPIFREVKDRGGDIHPVLLTNIEDVPNSLAIFVITRDQLTVTKVPLNSTDIDKLITTTYQKLNNRFDSEYLENLAQLYDVRIRPVESQLNPNQPISIIATGKLRYLPFEALYDSKSDQYLIQKYPINYLTRLSTRQVPVTQNTAYPPKILAIGNPKPEGILALNGAEEEVKTITTILPQSQAFIKEKATLNIFKNQATQFNLVHLATHGCFNPNGCCLSKVDKSEKPDLEANSILFADRSLNIADAATLGLQNVELITLSACQTALQPNSNGKEISGVAYLFERAGAKRVIASLWSADDGTTRTIMEQFYQNRKGGMSQAEALQKAKLSQIDSHPWYWSPFILIGQGDQLSRN